MRGELTGKVRTSLNDASANPVYCHPSENDLSITLSHRHLQLGFRSVRVVIRQTGAADVSLEAGLIHVNSLVLRGLEAEGVFEY